MTDRKRVLKCVEDVTGSCDYYEKYVNTSRTKDFAENDYGALLNAIAEFKYHSGWLCFQSMVHHIDAKNADKQLPNNVGRLLNGELAGKDVTLNIQQVNDGWSLVYIYESSNQKDGFEHCLVKDERLATINSIGRGRNEFALYRVYFEEGEQGYQPWCSRFVQFEITGEQR